MKHDRVGLETDGKRWMRSFLFFLLAIISGAGEIEERGLYRYEPFEGASKWRTEALKPEGKFRKGNSVQPTQPTLPSPLRNDFKAEWIDSLW